MAPSDEQNVDLSGPQMETRKMKQHRNSLRAADQMPAVDADDVPSLSRAVASSSDEEISQATTVILPRLADNNGSKTSSDSSINSADIEADKADGGDKVGATTEPSTQQRISLSIQRAEQHFDEQIQQFESEEQKVDEQIQQFDDYQQADPDTPPPEITVTQMEPTGEPLKAPLGEPKPLSLEEMVMQVLANQTVMREEQTVMREELNSIKEEMDENLNNAVVTINKSTEIAIMQARDENRQARDELRMKLVATVDEN
jgi:hypothetical protein